MHRAQYLQHMRYMPVLQENRTEWPLGSRLWGWLVWLPWSKPNASTGPSRGLYVDSRLPTLLQLLPLHSRH